MQALTTRSKVAVNKKMTFIERLYIPAIMGGNANYIKSLF